MRRPQSEFMCVVLRTHMLECVCCNTLRRSLQTARLSWAEKHTTHDLVGERGLDEYIRHYCRPAVSDGGGKGGGACYSWLLTARRRRRIRRRKVKVRALSTRPSRNAHTH